MKDNLIQTRSFEFAIEVVKLSRELKRHSEYVISDQLLRSGTSIGANVEEAIAAQSRKDFVSKMSIAFKEARETLYWLRLLRETDPVKRDYSVYLKKAEEIIRVLTAIVKTTGKANHGKAS